MVRLEMLDQDKGGSGSRRQAGEELLASIQTARGRADAGDTEIAGA